jgi:hypothetical protein
VFIKNLKKAKEALEDWEKESLKWKKSIKKQNFGTTKE